MSSGATPPVGATSPVETTVPDATEPPAVTDPIEGAPPVEAPAPVELPAPDTTAPDGGAPPVEATASEEAPPVAASAVQGVSGTVTETGSGAPVAGVFLAVLRSSDYTVAGGAVADGSGNYSAPVGAGSYYVYAIDPTGGHASGFFGAPTLVTVTAGATVDADPAMAPTRGSISATVTETGTGAPIGGVWGLALSASAANPGATELAVVGDGSGRLTLPGLTQANHYVGFVDPAGGHQTRFFPNSLDVPHAAPVVVTAGGTTEADASMPAQALVGTGATITGTVTEAGTNNPLTNARVFALRAADYQIVRATTTNPSGHYTLDLTQGAYKLAFLDADGRHHLEWYDNQSAAGLASAVSVTAPGNADAALNPSTATMAGTITDETTGDPIAHAWVIAIGQQGVAGGTATATDGTYTIAGLPPGTYRAAFIDPTGGRTMEYYDGAPSFSDSTPIALTTGTATIDATLGYPPPGAHCGPVTTHETWGPGVHQITCPIQIQAGGSVVLAAGAVVKVITQGYASDEWAVGLRVEPGGTLDVEGTAADPVRITSYKDDSLGGDTNGDGPSVGHAYDYGTAIQTVSVNQATDPVPATVTVSHLVVSYGWKAIGIEPQCYSPFGCPRVNNSEVTVTDSEFAHLAYGINLNGGGTQTGHLNVEGSTFTDITQTAIESALPAARLEGLTVSNSGSVLAVQQGAASFRGSVDHVDTGITACNWGGGCSVDASYVDWGTAEGPYPAGHPPMVCGSVTAAPWTFNGATADGNIFGSSNCDGSPPPDVQLGDAAAAAAVRINDLCALSQDACDIAQLYTTCLGAARQLAIANLPFPIDDGGVVSEIGMTVVDGASLYLRQSASSVVSSIGAVAAHAGQVLNVVNVLLSLKQAYDTCPPR